MNVKNHLGFLRNHRRVGILVVLAVIVLGGNFIYQKYFNLTSAQKAQKELLTVVAAVSRLMILPEGGEPVLASVIDADTLKKQQAFFGKAVNGDQLLLFPKNAEAILYSPSRNLIVNVGPIQQNTGAGNNLDANITAPPPASNDTPAISAGIKNNNKKPNSVKKK